MTTDYSAIAVSAILEQKHEDARDHVIAYASKCCNDAESKYGSSKGEFLAVVYGCQKFRHYLSGAKFTIVTDHAALQYLTGTRHGSHQVARWAMLLSDYDYHVVYRPGKSNANADGLSRAN